MVFTFPLTKRGDFAVFFVRGSKNSFYHSTNFTTNISTNIPNVDFPYTVLPPTTQPSQLAAYTSLPLYTQRIDLRYAWNDSPSSSIHKVPNY